MKHKISSFNQKKKNIFSRKIASFFSFFIRHSARILTGARSIWLGCKPENKQRIYYANHNSHIDFILLWSSLPELIRQQTRPIAASDYWLNGSLRRFLIQNAFSGVIIERDREKNLDPLAPVKSVLTQGNSIIFFPEGTRNLNDDLELLDFKSGLYYLHKTFPDIEIIPVWISNLKRVMPKGSIIPIPLLSSVTFGAPLIFEENIDKITFLKHAQQELLKLKEVEYL